MGKLIILATVTTYVALISSVISLKKDGWINFIAITLNVVAILANIAVIIRTYYEKKQYPNMRFPLCSILHIICVPVTVICYILLVVDELTGFLSSSYALALALVGYSSMLCAIGFVLIRFLIVYLCQRFGDAKAAKALFFLSADEKRTQILLPVLVVVIIIAIGSLVYSGIGGSGEKDSGGSQRCFNCGGDGWDSENHCECVWCNGDGKTEWNP